MSDLRAAIKLITGKEADEQQIQRLMAIAQALGIPQNDAMMPILGMLESYNRLYTNLPGEVAKQCKTEADFYAKAAATSAQSIVSIEIAKTMNELVGTAKEGILAATESAGAVQKANAITLATKIAVGGLIASAVLFFGVGYGVKSIAESVALATAKATMETERAQHMAALDAANAHAQAEIDRMAKSVGWLGTKEGRTARKFFDTTMGGMGMVAATCAADKWEIVQAKNGKWCVPKSKPFFGGDDQKYGWKIP